MVFNGTVLFAGIKPACFCYISFYLCQNTTMHLGYKRFSYFEVRCVEDEYHHPGP